MTSHVRRLRWRVTRGGHWIDLVEERRDGAAPIYVGMVDGREVLRGADRMQTGVALLHGEQGRSTRAAPPPHRSQNPAAS